MNKGLLSLSAFQPAVCADSCSVQGQICSALLLLASLLLSAGGVVAQTGSRPPQSGPPDLQSTEDWNRRLRELQKQLELPADLQGSALPKSLALEYTIGPEDLIEITVFEAKELDRTVRVSTSGEISLPLIGSVRAAGLSPRQLEYVLQELLRRTYLKDPHVSVFVHEMQSHPVSVFGAVRKAGVFQLRGPRTLVEVLSLAEGLDADAGDMVVLTRGGAYYNPSRSIPQSSTAQPANPSGTSPQKATQEPSTPAEATPTLEARIAGETLEISLKRLLETGDPTVNVLVYPGDLVRVNRAGIVYVVGEVKKPGGFVLKTNEKISLLQAVALAEGPTSVAAQGRSRIIRTDELTGKREELQVDLGKILEGRAPDPMLHARDIVFIPHSTARRTSYRAAEAAIGIVSGIIIWRR
jgi:polysaccharide export outer membrane protein